MMNFCLYFASFNLENKRMTILSLLHLAHLVSRFPCNTKVIDDASSSPPVSRIKVAVTKT